MLIPFLPFRPQGSLIKQQGQWQEANTSEEASSKSATTLEDEALVSLIHQQAAERKIYTVNQFAEAFENTAPLRGKSSIYQQVQRLAQDGKLHFFRDHNRCNLPPPWRSKFGYLCVDNMTFTCPKTGSVFTVSGETVPVEKLDKHPKTQKTQAFKNKKRAKQTC